MVFGVNYVSKVNLDLCGDTAKRERKIKDVWKQMFGTDQTEYGSER